MYFKLYSKQYVSLNRFAVQHLGLVFFMDELLQTYYRLTEQFCWYNQTVLSSNQILIHQHQKYNNLESLKYYFTET